MCICIGTQAYKIYRIKGDKRIRIKGDLKITTCSRFSNTQDNIEGSVEINKARRQYYDLQ